MSTFSATVSVGANVNSWVIATIPSFCARRGLGITTRSPSTRITPASGLSAPYSIFTRVDLPDPFSPAIACTSPGRSARLTSLSA